MKTIFLVLFVLMAASIKGYAGNDPFLPKTVDVAIGHAYIPQGFDSNDRTQFVIEGYLPNTCYRLAETETKYDELKKTLVVKQKAYLYNGLCLQVIVPFNRTVEFGILGSGSYNVKDGYTEQALGRLPIAPSLNSGPDDDFYAMVDEVQMGVIDNQAAILVRGNVPGSCWYIKEVKLVIESDDVITVLPVMGYDHNSPVLCTRENTPFSSSVKLPTNLNKGRYLVQVRSLSGQSVNKIYDLK